MLGRNIVVYFDCSINEDKVEKIKRKKRIKKKKKQKQKREEAFQLDILSKKDLKKLSLCFF